MQRRLPGYRVEHTMATSRTLGVILFLVTFSITARAQDNLPPTFLSPLAVFTPNEEQPAGTVIGIVLADDADRDAIRYYIAPGTINVNNFDVNETTGEVSFEQRLDREALAPNNEPLLLYVRATDGNDHGIADPQQEINVYLRDINDNSPMFTNLPRTVTFAENTNEETTILNVEVTDRDIGANAQLQYQIDTIDGIECITDCLFSIHQSSGIVTLEQSLDYESSRQHSISILVRDRGSIPNQVVAELTVAVEDVNDRNPAFLQNDYFAEVHENLTFGDIVTQVRAFDQDFGVNDDVSYSIISGNLEIDGTDSFAIDNETGVIYVNINSLDRETYQQYMLTVMASEVNDPTKTDTTRVQVTIFDINDHSPMFVESAYSVNVSESQALESVILTVTAMDRDFGVNADFQFELVNLLNSSLPLPFRIDHNELSGEGRIVLIEELDYEDQIFFLIHVIATEVIDDSPRNGSTVVSVSVINENDNAPIFVNQSYTASVPENAPPGIFVITVRATDDDVGIFGEVEYSFQETVLDFNISVTNGHVVTAKELDYEMQSQYVLSIMANDLHPTLSRQDTVQLTVNLENINDNPPQFVEDQMDVDALVVTAPEEVTPPLNVYTFNVLDLDGDLNELTFEIVEGNILGHFEIEGAQLRTTIPLNFDLRTSGTRYYNLTVSVNDTEHVDFVTVDVVVLDINDNDPEFENDTYNFFVQENEDEGFIVGTVFAEDIDSGTFGEIMYSISGLGSENFEINATSGIIQTSSQLDRELRQEAFNLMVTATDQDENVANRNQVSVPLTITVLDENDNSPQFGESTYIFEVEENTDFIVFQVDASDSDVGSNAEIRYNIVDGNIEQTFLIGERSGTITRNASVFLDRERVSVYTLNVSAMDGGVPSNAATVQVIINILDVNDVIPTFTQTEYNVTIREDISANSIVTDELLADDNDANEFGQVTYSIVSVTAPMDSELTGSFVIVPNTGVVRTTGTFDREVFPGPYTIMVLGRDGGFPVSNNGTATLLVYIEDANDNRPIFNPASYRQSIAEGLPRQQPITNISAMDGDQINTPNSQIIFSITDILGFDTTTDVMNHFIIDSTSGEIFTNVSLDYETVRSYRITVEASDAGVPQRSSNAFVSVTVLDINDHEPVLSSELYEFNIPEDTSINSRFSLIQATDNDATTNAQITYSIDITSPFSIDPANGELILTDSLDFETTTNYTFSVTATDGGGLSDESDVQVTVMDANDHRPTFDQELYSVAIEEGDYSLSSVTLLKVMASDDDSGLLGTVTYAIVPPSDKFSINTELGEILVVGELDRETTDFYRITVTATDGGSSPESSTATIEITVNDVNDVVPSLDRTEYSVAIPENSIPGDIIADVQATDEDAEENGTVLFSFLDSPSSSLFEIDELTGEIRALTTFDYEITQNFVLTILATDNSTAPLATSARFYVNITDRNDNAPVFGVFPGDQRLSEITSTGKVIVTVSATDEDSGDNGDIFYQLSNDEGKFSISSSGVITLVNSLDREITDQYNLTVSVFDRGQPQMSAIGYLLISVEDENDVVPTFLSDTYSFLVSEDVPLQTTVGTVFADDSDLGSNANTRFLIVEGDAAILFNLVTNAVAGPSGTQRFAGVLTTRQGLDYEAVTSYSFTIVAMNTELPRPQSFVNVTVTVRDTNDNTPRFSSPGGYDRSVSERAPVGTPVGTVVATDRDGGLNGTITYTIGNGTQAEDRSTFSIDNSTGVITVAATLNFEGRRQYNLIIIASDNAPPTTRQSASVNFRVTVLDFNEMGPVFSQNVYMGRVDESIDAGVSVVMVNATEGDGGSIFYSIVAGDRSRFQIDTTTGLVTTRLQLDREEQSSYTLTVQASDGPAGDVNALASFAQVEVTVIDANDNPPVFSQTQYEFFIPEHSPVGEVVAIVTASDRDTGSNALLSYSLSTGAGQFRVNSETGNITVASPSALDRETMPRINILLTATDNGGERRASTVPITVVLTNINDFSPVFDSPSYSQSLPENSQAGVSILTVQATDGDGDTVRYSIANGDDPAPNRKFTINAETGLLETTSNILDRESLVARDYTYRLSVVGTDNGGIMGGNNRSTTVDVIITVTDVNDISPQCPSATSTFTMAEANSLEVRVGQITATDGDSGTNAVVNYQIAAGDISGQFRISTSTGDLFARPGLDFETTPEYNLRIAAIDQAVDPTNRRTSTCMVTVILTDENDNRPVFDAPLYEASVLENATIGHTVTIVSANDDDSGSNGDITYSFQSSVQVFAVDRLTGVITVSGSLDSETLNRYELDVEATDGGLPRRIGVAQVTIQVVNVNDNSPRFDRSFYMEDVSEDARVDTSIITITASDPDSPSLKYAITEGNDEGYFKINSASGLIQTARNLDREQVAVFNLLIVAEDEGTNQGTTRLQVIVTDVNDEAPQFLQQSYFAKVTENSPRGTQVIPEVNMTTIRIEAIDSDEPNTQNSRVLYRLDGENSDLFSINFDTGIITVARGTDLDYETLPEIIISIVASDSVPVPNTQTSSVELRIQVLDENDNPPVFSQRFGYVIPVEENHPVDTIISNEIQANDPDTGAGGEVRYSISNANPLEALQWFSINRTSGDLMLIEPLDRESFSIITLMVAGSDQGVPPLSSIVSVQIAVGDVNDNAPRFTQNIYTSSVPEFLATGSSAIRVSAEDPDVGSNGEVVFSLLPPTALFSINPVTGQVITTGTLDHETRSSHSLTVQVCDNGDVQLCDTSVVVINVIDFNDETPRFDLSVYTVDVCHTALSGDPLVQPVATDQDSGTNAQLTYTLNEVWELTIVDNTTGLISLDRDINDLDVSVGQYEFIIVATDSGARPLSGSATVVIRVLNCTEQEFVYSSPYFYFEIREGVNAFTDGRTGQVLGPARSPESATFYPGEIPGNPFNINLNLLTVKSETELESIGLINGLDREYRDLYTVIIRASRLSEDTFTSVTVRVLDANDNSPMFQSELYVFDVVENNTEVLTVGAVFAEDQDEGSNAVIKYTLLGVSPPGDHPFIVNSTTGLISAMEFGLDREVVDEFQLNIQASDGLTSNTTSVEVNVLDINDCTPTFTQPSYNEKVLENLPAGVVVRTVTASDCDSGNNAVVQYTIVAGDISVFEIDFVSGEITTLVMLDYESVSSYYLRIRASDMGSPVPLTSEVDVFVMVEDFNDCPPEFIEPPSSFTVREDADENSLLLTFRVNDCDGGLNGVNGTRYSIIAGNEENRFNILEETGDLLTIAALDRELRGSYLLSIQARDSAIVNRLSSVIQLNVIIEDVNDNDPVFIESVISITVGEGEEVGEVLVQGELANDDDSGINGQITYSLLDNEEVFGIDANTGTITLSSSLDRETVDSYELTVIARDRADEPRSSNATIFVIVRDANDNPPVFLNITSGVTVASVGEDADIGTLVYNVRARDDDDGSNGEVSFSLDDPNQPFDISPSGGAITVSDFLDYETRNEYTLVVIATDRGAPQPLSTLARLTVRVTDKNDNPPAFEQTTYAGSQDENIAVGTSILSVLARDNDQTGSVNAQVEYSLIDGDVEYFSVDPMSGEISNQVVLDRERQSSFSLTVLANNSLSSTPLTGTATVTITVSDVNDEYPQFVGADYERTLSESDPQNTRVVDVDAFDNDEDGSPNSDLIYSINVMTNIGNLFHIDSDTGLITLQNSLDFETRPFFALEVVAEDKGSVPLRNTTIVYVNVTDANDIVPAFTQASYTTSVREGVTVLPQMLTILQYTDGDSTAEFRRSTFAIRSVQGPNGEPVSSNLFLASTSPTNFSGSVSLNGPVDYENLTNYRVMLTVTNVADLSNNLCPPAERPCRQSSTAVLEVNVLDANDHTPQFTQTRYSGEVSTNAPPDTSILSVSASDDDRSREFSTVKYRIDDASLREGKFRIDENTGTLFTRIGFEEDVGLSYSLTVTAFDNDGQEPSLSNTSLVRLVVLDNFQRVAILFQTSLTTIVNKQNFIVQLLENLTNYDVVVEQYASYSNETHTRFIFHAIDSNNKIIGFNDFLDRLGDNYNIIFDRLRDCNITTIMSFATLTVYGVPPLLDRETIVILVFCFLLILGAFALLAMAMRQRFVGWSQEKLKEGAMATNHLFGPGGLEEQGHYHTDAVEEQYELMQKGNFLNPMYVVPVSDPLADVETSAAGSTTGLSSMHRNNPLYESQEISMDMFKEPDYDDDDDDMDDDGTDALAAALDEDEDEEAGGGGNIDDEFSDDDVERTMI